MGCSPTKEASKVHSYWLLPIRCSGYTSRDIMPFGKVVRKMTWRNTYSGGCLQLPCSPAFSLGGSFALQLGWEMVLPAFGQTGVPIPYSVYVPYKLPHQPFSGKRIEWTFNILLLLLFNCPWVLLKLLQLSLRVGFDNMPFTPWNSFSKSIRTKIRPKCLSLRCALRESSCVLGDCLVLLTMGDTGSRELVFIFLAGIPLLSVHFLDWKGEGMKCPSSEQMC